MVVKKTNVTVALGDVTAGCGSVAVGVAMWYQCGSRATEGIMYVCGV